MAQAKDLLKNRSKDQIYYTNPAKTVGSAITYMAEKNVGALLVEDEAGKVVGIVTERDVLLKHDAKGRDASNCLVSEIMTTDVISVSAKQSVEECMEIMNEKGFRHLPVFDGENLLGLISVKDVLRQVIADQKHLLDHLENYISGS